MPPLFVITSSCLAMLLSCRERFPGLPPEARGDAPAAEPSAPDPSSEHPAHPLVQASGVGDSARQATYSMEVLKVRTCGAGRHPAYGLLGTMVEIAALEDEVSVLPRDIRALDADGLVLMQRRLSPDSPCYPELLGMRLGPSEKARGYVAFETPRDASQVVLRYNPARFGPAEPIEIALPIREDDPARGGREARR